MTDDLRVEEVYVDAGPPAAASRRLVLEAAASFLDAQRRLLRSGLDHATERTVVADVTRRHEAAHEAWVSTVAALRDHVDEDIVQQVIDLYGFHGRVAGGLAGERSLRLEGPVEVGVRRILGDQLDQMTERVLTQLRADLGPPPRGSREDGAG